MGSGYSLRCEVCGDRKSLLTGVGFRRPDYQTLLGRMKSGEFGEDIQKAVLKRDPERIGSSNCIYYCSHCTQARTMPDLTMTFIVKTEELKKMLEKPSHKATTGSGKEEDKKSNRELEDIREKDLIWNPDGNEKEHRITVHARVRCQQCGKEMKKYSDPYKFLNVVRGKDFVCESCHKGIYKWSSLMFWD